MGSNQSSPAAGTDAGTSFSIDPSGNITRKSQTDSKNPKSTGVPLKQQQYSDKENSNNNTDINDDSNIEHAAPATPIDEPQSFIVPLKPVVVAAAAVEHKQSDELSLDEADNMANQLKAKYKPDNLNMIGKQQSAFNAVERNLVQCYAANKSQTLNCSQAYQEYKDYVASQRSQLLKKSVNVPSLITTVLVVITCLLLHVTQISCYGAMSIDLGSEWMKVGLVAPSVQMDIVLNAQSQRKTPMAIAFSNGERFIGDTALDVASKYPERTYTHFLDLIGKSIEHESVKHYKQRFPYANITPATTTTTSPETKTLDHNSIILNHPQGLEFTPLELIAMMLEHAHDQVITRLNSNEPASDVVITVPPFFGPSERQVIQDAAKLVGLNVLRLTNTNSAFALSYGIFRHKDYLPESDANKTSILFFDQGASHTSITLADYHFVEHIELSSSGVSKNESLPTIRIRAQVYDRFLGGFDMQLKLRDHLVRAFAKKTGIKESKITQRGKSMAKLLKESGRVKKILSANTEHVVRVENVIDDKDLKEPISRREFEELNKEYLDNRITDLLDKLYTLPGVSRDERLESVIIVGGNTRTPRIQQTLLDYFKLEVLGKSINADEGAALAALYQAASLGRGFRVKKFVLVEFNETSAATVSGNDDATVAPIEEVASPATEAPTSEQSVVDFLEGSRKKLATLREQDHLRLQRLSSRNSLESLLSEARDKLDEKEDADKLRQVSEAYAWLEDGPQHETDNITLLADKFHYIHELVYPKPPPQPPMFDPSSVDLSRVLSNETLSVLNSLNFTNPFAARSEENNETTASSTSSEMPTLTTTTTPRTLEPAPAPSVAPTKSEERGPPPHSEL